jgi:hypothetical protein
MLFGDDDRGYLKEGVESQDIYWHQYRLLINSSTFFYLHIYSLWVGRIGSLYGTLHQASPGSSASSNSTEFLIFFFSTLWDDWYEASNIVIGARYWITANSDSMWRKKTMIAFSRQRCSLKRASRATVYVLHCLLAYISHAADAPYDIITDPQWAPHSVESKHQRGLSAI